MTKKIQRKPKEEWCDICGYEFGELDDGSADVETFFMEDDNIWAHQSCLDERAWLIDMVAKQGGNNLDLAKTAERLGIRL
jgi:uncharacterized protein YdaU (DUF1376 family)